jgi:hypothetical protein
MNSASVQILILCAVPTEQIIHQCYCKFYGCSLQFTPSSGVYIKLAKLRCTDMYIIEDCIAFYWKIDLVYKQILYRLNISPKVHRWNLSKLYGT